MFWWAWYETPFSPDTKHAFNQTTLVCFCLVQGVSALVVVWLYRPAYRGLRRAADVSRSPSRIHPTKRVNTVILHWCLTSESIRKSRYLFGISGTKKRKRSHPSELWKEPPKTIFKDTLAAARNAGKDLYLHMHQLLNSVRLCQGNHQRASLRDAGVDETRACLRSQSFGLCSRCSDSPKNNQRQQVCLRGPLKTMKTNYFCGKAFHRLLLIAAPSSDHFYNHPKMSQRNCFSS